MARLLFATPEAWTETVLSDFGAFLQDHAANERKAAQSALVMAAQHPRHIAIVDAMIGVAEDELAHFRQVWGFLRARDLPLPSDAPDPYMQRFMKHLRRDDHDLYLLDRLLAFGLVEARGCDRFACLAAALPAGDLRDFYSELVASEARHHGLFVRLAKEHFDAAAVEERLDELVRVEAEVAKSLPLRAALH